MKYFLTLFLLFINFFSFYAQENKNPFLIQFNMGVSFELPHKSIFKKNNLQSTEHFDLRVQKYINQKIFLSLDLQQTKYNIYNDFIKTFQDEYYEDETTISSSNFPINKAVFNIGYFKKNKKENRELAVSIGLGVQKFSFIENDSYLFAYVGNRSKQTKLQESSYINPLLQLTIENTLYINNIGINIGIKTQYAKLLKPITYVNSTLRNFSFNEEEIESSKKDFLILTPTIGLRYDFNK